MKLVGLLKQIQAERASKMDLKVTDEQWREWQDQLTLDLICGFTIGQSFAEFFDIQDLFLLFGNPPRVQIEQHINHYYR